MPGVRVRAAAMLAVPGVLAFTVPPLGFVASFLLPVLSARVRSRLWPRTSPVAGHLCAALALAGLWLPALLALASSGRLGLEATAWLAVSYTHLRAHETDSYLVCRLLLE